MDNSYTHQRTPLVKPTLLNQFANIQLQQPEHYPRQRLPSIIEEGNRLQPSHQYYQPKRGNYPKYQQQMSNSNPPLQQTYRVDVVEGYDPSPGYFVPQSHSNRSSPQASPQITHAQFNKPAMTVSKNGVGSPDTPSTYYPYHRDIINSTPEHHSPDGYSVKMPNGVIHQYPSPDYSSSVYDTPPHSTCNVETRARYYSSEMNPTYQQDAYSSQPDIFNLLRDNPPAFEAPLPAPPQSTPYSVYRSSVVDSPQGSPLPVQDSVFRVPYGTPPPPQNKQSRPPQDIYKVDSPLNQLYLQDMSLNSPRPRPETFDMKAPSPAPNNDQYQTYQKTAQQPTPQQQPPQPYNQQSGQIYANQPSQQYQQQQSTQQYPHQQASSLTKQQYPQQQYPQQQYPQQQPAATQQTQQHPYPQQQQQVTHQLSYQQQSSQQPYSQHHQVSQPPYAQQQPVVQQPYPQQQQVVQQPYAPQQQVAQQPYPSQQQVVQQPYPSQQQVAQQSLLQQQHVAQQVYPQQQESFPNQRLRSGTVEMADVPSSKQTRSRAGTVEMLDSTCSPNISGPERRIRSGTVEMVETVYNSPQHSVKHAVKQDKVADQLPSYHAANDKTNAQHKTDQHHGVEKKADPVTPNQSAQPPMASVETLQKGDVTNNNKPHSTAECKTQEELERAQKLMQQQYVQRVRQAQLQQQLRDIQNEYDANLQLEQDIAQEFLREQTKGTYECQQRPVYQPRPPYRPPVHRPAYPRPPMNYPHQQQQQPRVKQPIVIMPGGNPNQFVPPANQPYLPPANPSQYIPQQTPPQYLPRQMQYASGQNLTKKESQLPATGGVKKQPTPFQKLRKTAEEISSFVDDIVKFKGKKGDHEYKYLEEMLTQQLLSLDMVAADSSDELRSARKALVKEVQELLEILERRAGNK